MKKLLITMLLAVSSASIMAQGTVNFANGAVGVNAPIYEIGGSPALGTAYKAELYYAAGTVTDSSALSLLAGSGTTFNAGGYFLGGEKALPGILGGGTATLQVRAWRASDGASWAVASTTVGAHVGQGNLITLALGGVGAPPSAAVNMVGLTSFNLYQVVPEPSTVALGVLAAGSLLFIRRRK